MHEINKKPAAFLLDLYKWGKNLEQMKERLHWIMAKENLGL